MTVKGEFQCALLSNIFSVTFEFFLVFLHCNICIVRVQFSSVEVEVDTGNKWFSKLIMFAVLSPRHIFSSAVNGSLAVQGALCTVHCTRCRVQGAVARQEVVTGWLPRPQGPLYSHLAHNRFKIVHTSSPRSVQPCRSQTQLQLRRPLSLVQPNRWSTLVY